MKKLILLFVFYIFTLSSFSQVSDYEFIVKVTEFITPHYDYIPGSHCCLPLRVRPETSHPNGYPACCSNVAFQVMEAEFESGRKSSSTKGKFRAQEGITIGYMMPYNCFGEDFNGKKYLEGSDALILLPKIKSNIGYGITFGLMGETVLWDIYFLYSKHKVEMKELQFTSNAHFSTFGMNFGFKFLRQPHIHPYILLGAGGGSIYIDSSAVKFDLNKEDYKIANAEFINFMINVGIGSVFYITKRLGIRGEIYYRFYSFKRVELSIGGAYNLEDKVKAGAMNFSLILSFTFGKNKRQ